MEFLHKNNDEKSSPVDALRCNWFLRPRDVGRYNSDTRLLYATMQSDISPITSLRGKVTIMHRDEIKNLDEYRRKKDFFWFSQMYDRFIHRFFEVVPTRQVINVPERVKRVLDERWKYVIVEPQRKLELTSAIKSCKRCEGYCARYV